MNKSTISQRRCEMQSKIREVSENSEKVRKNLKINDISIFDESPIDIYQVCYKSATSKQPNKNVPRISSYKGSKSVRYFCGFLNLEYIANSSIPL